MPRGGPFAAGAPTAEVRALGKGAGAEALAAEAAALDDEPLDETLESFA